jgi:hypothetical protein
MSLPLRAEDVVRLVPHGSDDINMSGRYAFVPPDAVARGKPGLLRDLSLVNDDADCFELSVPLLTEPGHGGVAPCGRTVWRS